MYKGAHVVALACNEHRIKGNWQYGPASVRGPIHSLGECLRKTACPEIDGCCWDYPRFDPLPRGAQKFTPCLRKYRPDIISLRWWISQLKIVGIVKQKSGVDITTLATNPSSAPTLEGLLTILIHADIKQ